MANNIVVDIVADTRSLVRGVNETNSKLNSLTGSVNKISGAFKGIAAAFGLSVGISWFKDAIKGAEEEKKTFAALALEYGAEADAIVEKVNGISKMFYVDDGAVAQLVLDLRGKLRAELDPLAADIAAGTIALSKVMNVPLDEMSAKVLKALKDGKITMTEVQNLGIKLTEEQQKSFDAAFKAGKSVEWMMNFLTSEEFIKKAQKLTTPWEKLSFTFNEIKDAIGDKLLKGFEKLFDFFTDTNAEGVTSVNNAFKDMRDIILVMVSAGVAIKFITFLQGWKKAVEGLTISNILLNIVMNANPVGLIITAIAALIVIIILVIRHWDDVSAAFKKGGEKIRELWNGFVKFIKDLFKDVDLVKPFKQMIENVVGFFRGLGSTFYNIGKDLIMGIINGIGGMIGSAINKVKELAGKITSSIKNFLGINSPSKVFMSIGSGITEGLIKGIDKTAYLAVNSVKDLGKSLQIPMELSPLGGIGNAIPSASAQTITVNISAGLGTDSYELGRVVSAALDKYAGVNGR